MHIIFNECLKKNANILHLGFLDGADVKSILIVLYQIPTPRATNP